MKDLKEPAQRLIDSKNIIENLSRFGDVHLVGSFVFDLMCEPDIDIVVITDTPKESSEKALDYFSKLHLFQKLEYGDFQKFPKENRPPFYIFNMRTPWEGEIFEVETWFMPEAEEKINFCEMMKKITVEQRQKIMELKLQRKNDGISKKQFPSFEIYKRVLNF